MERIKVGIIGLGQMGASLGFALKSKSAGNKYYIIGVSRKRETLKTALKTGAADKVSLSLQDVKGCGIVVICTPVDTIVPIYKQLSEIVDKSTIITDTGSVKHSIECRIEELRVKSENTKSVNSALSFVGSHPMAGNEKKGIFSADAQMFKGANVIITGKFTQKEKIIAKMWKDAGANIINMSAKKHDELAALTSHLTHCIAFSFNKVYKDAKRKDPEIDKITAGSFKSMVRVASSNADMWAPIFAANGENIIKRLDAFIKELNAFKKVLKNKAKVKKEILRTQL
ncbi:MAG: prephenate dehydrogenase [Endomicrobium sp.]|jgi:prephenate dehydrogenase|nr:prephenate dehydrogenase [Endomicrobium sp.]